MFNKNNTWKQWNSIFISKNSKICIFSGEKRKRREKKRRRGSTQKQETHKIEWKYLNGVNRRTQEVSNNGGRIIINLEKLYLSLKKLELKSEKPEEYYNFSFKLGIPQKNMDKLKNKIFGIECNFEELNGIDFKKGCYVGQENTARIKLKDKQSKRLLPVDLIKGDLKEGSLIYNNNKEVGKILINGEYHYALVKYRSEYFDTNLELTSENAILKIRLPEWITLN